MDMRRSLSEPIPEIFEAANFLLEALNCHRHNDIDGAIQYLKRADNRDVWVYTDRAWGKGAKVRYGFQTLPDSPPHLAILDRPRPRMPDTKTKKAVVDRDGYHCRFCGIPVIDSSIRQLLVKTYPTAVGWGKTNETQHAAFQSMWLQYDHVLPNSRGGHSGVDNIIVACAACNFGRMETTLAEANLIDPFSLPPPIRWNRYAEWNGLEDFRVICRARS